MSEGVIIAIIGAASVILEAIILRKQKQSEKRQADAHERTEIILEATEASLEGLKQLGANGRVTESLKRLEDYKNKKAAK